MVIIFTVLFHSQMRLRIVISLCCLFSYVMVSAQSPKRSSVRRFNAAIRYHEHHEAGKAYKKMMAAIRKSPRSPIAYSQLGQWYFSEHRFQEAANIFRKASAKCKNGRSAFARPYAKSLMYCGQADSALQLISTYSDHKENGEWEHMRQQALFIKQAYFNSRPLSPVNLGIRVNTDYPELFPSVTTDTSTLYFTRRVNNMDEDFYQAYADSCGGWFYALNMGSPPNTPDQESAQTISADGHYLFFTRCENRSEDGWAEGGCDMFMAYRVAPDSDWTVPQPFGSTINTTDYEGMPALSPDNRELYFVSDRPGGYGGYDIWISRFEDGLWQQPVNAGPNVNTAGNETAPFIGMDNKTLYFTSDGWPGMGGTDLFMARKTGDTTWGHATNLGYPINSACDEQSECVTNDGATLYFASDRNGPAGNYDIYQAEMPYNLKPQPVGFINGIVYDSLTKARLNFAVIHVCNAVTGDTIYQFQSNRGDGSFTMVLPTGIKYAIHTARMGYTEINDTTFFGKENINAPQERNMVMLPSDYVKPLNDTLVAMLHFDVNVTDLSDSDKLILHKAIDPWLKGKEEITIYVNGYTDNTGTPMINEELSFKRAGIVSKAIAAMGISKHMVRSNGWGESKMIAPNTTEEGQRMNRRVEVIIRH